MRDKSFRSLLRIAGLLALVVIMPSPLNGETEQRQVLLEHLETQTHVEEIHPSSKAGREVRLIYYAPVNVAIFWKFKTDFQNDWLVSHKYITAHRFINRHRNVVISETHYSNGPDVFFRWRTELFPRTYEMHYTLLNANACGQRFNRGWIKLEPAGEMTRIIHTSNFDFTGAFLWAHLPGPWGMKGFLRYTARWEQKTILRLKSRYAE